MSRKESDGTKVNQKSQLKNNKNRNIYSSKTVRMKEKLLEKNKNNPKSNNPKSN